MGDKAKRAMTDLTVRNAAPGLHADSGPDRVRGLFLRVSPTGSRYFFVRYMLQGRRRDLGLGSYPELSLSDARGKALDARRLKAEKVDPVEARRDRQSTNRRDQALATWTFQRCAEEVHNTLTPGWKNEKHAEQWISTLKTYAFPRIGEKPAAEIDVAAVLEVLRPIWTEKAETARRVRQRIDAVMTWAEAHGYASKNPTDAAAALLPKQRGRVTHHRALPYRQVPVFIDSLGQRQVSVGALALEFLILTAARTGEVRLARREEFDLDAALWVIPADRMKAGREHRVPLAGRAIEILRTAFSLAPDAPLAFAGTGGRPLSDMALNAVMRRMEAAGVPHGFRSSFRDWCAENGISKDLAELSLAHAVGNAVEQAYNRTDLLEQRRPVLQAWADFVADQRSEKVVPIRQAAAEAA